MAEANARLGIPLQDTLDFRKYRIKRLVLHLEAVSREPSDFATRYRANAEMIQHMGVARPGCR